MERRTAFGLALRDARRARSLMIKDLAAMMGVSSAYLSAVECGRKHITARVLSSVCDALRADERLRDELSRAAELSPATLFIDLRMASETDRAIAAVFAKRIGHLSRSQKRELARVLEG